RLASVTDKRHAVVEGVSFELACENGSLLFDVGMKPTPQLLGAAQRASVVVVSHAHRDHAEAAAIAAVLDHSRAPLLMTELTLNQLVSLVARHVSGEVADLVAKRSLLIGANEPRRFGCGSHIEF